MLPAQVHAEWLVGIEPSPVIQAVFQRGIPAGNPGASQALAPIQQVLHEVTLEGAFRGLLGVTPAVAFPVVAQEASRVEVAFPVVADAEGIDRRDQASLGHGTP
jgi:hypothetical protein